MPGAGQIVDASLTHHAALLQSYTLTESHPTTYLTDAINVMSGCTWMALSNLLSIFPTITRPHMRQAIKPPLEPVVMQLPILPDQLPWAISSVARARHLPHGMASERLQKAGRKEAVTTVPQYNSCDNQPDRKVRAQLDRLLLRHAHSVQQRRWHALHHRGCR